MKELCIAQIRLSFRQETHCLLGQLRPRMPTGPERKEGLSCISHIHLHILFPQPCRKSGFIVSWQLRSWAHFLPFGFFSPLGLKMILVIRPPQVLACGMPLLFRKQGNYQGLQKGKSELWHLENNHISLPRVAFGGEK